MPTTARRRPSTSIAANPSDRSTGGPTTAGRARLMPRGELVGDRAQLGDGLDHVVLMSLFQPDHHRRRRAGRVDQRAQEQRMPGQTLLERRQRRRVARGGPDGSRHRHRVRLQVDVLDGPLGGARGPGCGPSRAGGRAPAGRRRSTRAAASRRATRRAARRRCALGATAAASSETRSSPAGESSSGSS